MPKWFYGVILCGILAAVVAGAFVWYTDKPSTYNECLVREMRGQSPQMMNAVSKMCAIKFHKEEELPLSFLKDKLDFVLLPDFKADPKTTFIGSVFEKAPMQVTVLKNQTDYEVTRLRMEYSYKFVGDCSNLQEDESAKKLEYR